MRVCVVAGILILSMAELASAQARVVPSLRFASREYGVSGSYSRHKDADNKNMSDLNVLGHWGLISNLGPQLEIEGGYGRQTFEAVDSTGQNYSLAVNLLMNYSATEGFGIFGLIGYGYVKHWGDRTIGVSSVSTSSGYSIFQYGGGLKWLFVPNVALRVEYRRQTDVKTKASDPNKARDIVVIGVAILQ